MHVGTARLLTGCIGAVVTYPDHRHLGVATALMHDALAYAQSHHYALLLLDGIPKFYYRYGYDDGRLLRYLGVLCLRCGRGWLAWSGRHPVYLSDLHRG